MVNWLRKLAVLLAALTALALVMTGCPESEEEVVPPDDLEQGAEPDSIQPLTRYDTASENNLHCYELVTVKAGTSFSNNPIAAFEIWTDETIYDVWYPVKAWAEENAGYKFANNGNNGAGTSAAGDESEKLGYPGDPWNGKWPYSHSDGDKGVTNINLRDAMVWCNAFSEAMGKQPVYRNGNGSVLKDATKAVEEFVDWSKAAGKNGYRLLTVEEWLFASQKMVLDLSQTEASWRPGTAANMGSRSDAELVSRAITTDGVHWMTGNAWEWCYNKNKTYGLMGGDIYYTKPDGSADSECSTYDWNIRPGSDKTPEEKGNLTTSPAVSFRIRVN